MKAFEEKMFEKEIVSLLIDLKELLRLYARTQRGVCCNGSMNPDDRGGIYMLGVFLCTKF
jgi:hypothetical protein